MRRGSLQPGFWIAVNRRAITDRSGTVFCRIAHYKRFWNAIGDEDLQDLWDCFPYSLLSTPCSPLPTPPFLANDV
ncbi:hypothetical protein, partial [Limnofasciculus baicalensis]